MTPNFSGRGYEIYELSKVDGDMAREMAAVGIIPTLDAIIIGDTFVMAGQTFKVTAEATRQEFLDAVSNAGYPVALFAQCPANYRFVRVSTD